MNWKEHIILGLIFEIPFIIIMLFWKKWFYDFSSIFVFEILIIIFISPVFVDLDHYKSKLREGLTATGLLIGIVGILGVYINNSFVILKDIGLILSCLAFFLAYITVHRGFVHSIPMCVIYSIGIYIITTKISFASLALLGSYTHLLGDKIPFKLW